MVQEKARQFPCLRLLGRCVSARNDLLRFGLDLWLITVQRFECAGISRAQIIRNNQLGVLLLAGEVLGHCAIGLVWSVNGTVVQLSEIQAYTAEPILAFGDWLSCHCSSLIDSSDVGVIGVKNSVVAEKERVLK